MMTTQAYMPEMQAHNSAGSQQVIQVQSVGSQQQQQQQAAASKAAAAAAHSILQSSQSQYGGPIFTVSVASDHNGGDPENLQIQHGSGQVVYQSQQVYTDYGQAGMYPPGAYYDASAGVVQGQTVSQSGDAYLVHGSFVDGEATGLAHTIRASPATVQWLLDNYETAEGVSLPRSTLYTHYLRHCHDSKLEPMNPASFGKLIRSVFMGLRTRRLGTRGNSQYHYYGIRIKSMSTLNQFASDQMSASRQHALHQAKRLKSDVHDSGSTTDSSPVSQPSSSVASGPAPGPLPPQPSAASAHQQFLGDAAVPEFGRVEVSAEQLGGAGGAGGLTRGDVEVFELLYKDHCEAFLEIVVTLQFHLIETLWTSFWRTSPEDPESEMEVRLPRERLYALSELGAVREYVRRADFLFYQALVRVLIPDVLRPIPSQLTQSIRNFGKSLDGWLRGALVGVPDEMIKTKVCAVSALAQILRRYTSLNHLAQAARAVLQNGAQIQQMLTDINKVDFANVQEQASWVCECGDGVVRALEQDFKRTLQQQTSLEQWAAWLEAVVTQALGPAGSEAARPGRGPADFPRAARQFLLKWSFYSSMVIRDLTLRSAASFGSFHLIRLLYDEYMFYLVEHKVAAATGETSIAVMSERPDFGDDLSFAGAIPAAPPPVALAAPPPPPHPIRLIPAASVTGVRYPSTSFVGANHSGGVLPHAAAISLKRDVTPAVRPTLTVISSAPQRTMLPAPSNSVGGVVTVMPPTRTIVLPPTSCEIGGSNGVGVPGGGAPAAPNSKLEGGPTPVKLFKSD